MKIREIRAAGLRGSTPEGGWSHELRPEDCVHTLVAVLTDEGATGVGSVFAGEALVRAALQEMAPLYLGADPFSPERLSEVLHQNTFWLGRGGTLTHTISGIDIALWDLWGKVTGQPVGRLLGGRYRERVRPYASLLMQEPAALAEVLLSYQAQGFAAFKMGWGPFGRVSLELDEVIVRAAREAVGAETLLMVDAGGSDAFWPHGTSGRCAPADMLARLRGDWSKEPLPPPTPLSDYALLRRAARLPIAGGEVLTRRRPSSLLERARSTFRPPDVTKVGGISRRRRQSPGWPRSTACALSPRRNPALGLAADLQLAAAFCTRTWWIHHRSPYITRHRGAPWRPDAAG